MGLSHLHVVHKHPKRQPEPEPAEIEERDASGCPNNFYTSPAMSSTVDALKPLAISWNPACLPSTTKQLVIYLYTAAGDLTSTSNSSRLHVWNGIDASKGTYTAELMPRWWGASSSQLLQVSIVPAEVPIFMNTLPGGPIFTATYTPSQASGTAVPAAANTNIVDAPITQVGDLATHNAGLSGGKKAAAVIIPLLFIGLCAAAYLKLKRSRNVEKRKKWTEAVDKRMSTISTDWKSVSGAGANAAIRNSIAVANRNSSFSFGALRPSSTFAVEGEDGNNNNEKRSAANMRTGVGLRNPAGLTSTTSVDRVSRVSFAPDTRVSRVSFADSANTRPSGESRRTRAFHSAYIPPVPALPASAAAAAQEKDIADEEEDEEEVNDEDEKNTAGSFSPRQTQGALTLTPEDIRSRIVAGRARAASNAQKQQQQQQQQADSAKLNHNNNNNSNFEELMPALAMMRTGSSDPSRPDEKSDELLFNTAPPPVSPVSPPPAYHQSKSGGGSVVPYYSNTSNSVTYPQLQSTTQMQMQMQSPVMSTMPMQPMPANVMSPDEMLRAYAERKKALAASAASAGSSSSLVSSGKPVISYPIPVANSSDNSSSSSNTMRVLYNAATTTPSTTNTTNNNNANNNNNTESQYSIGTDSSSFVYNPPYHQNAQFNYNFSSPSSADSTPTPTQQQYPFGQHHHHQANGSVGVGSYGGARYSIGGEGEGDEEDAYDVHGQGQGQGQGRAA